MNMKSNGREEERKKRIVNMRNRWYKQRGTRRYSKKIQTTETSSKLNVMEEVQKRLYLWKENRNSVLFHRKWLFVRGRRLFKNFETNPSFTLHHKTNLHAKCQLPTACHSGETVMKVSVSQPVHLAFISGVIEHRGKVLQAEIRTLFTGVNKVLECKFLGG